MKRLEDLEPVDRRIAQMILDGATNKAIARALGMPEGTVKWRIHRLYTRVGVSSRVQFARRITEGGR